MIYAELRQITQRGKLHMHVNINRIRHAEYNDDESGKRLVRPSARPSGFNTLQYNALKQTP